MTLFEHAQRLNIALTQLMASAIQIGVLMQSDLPVGKQSYADFFERSAVCSGQIAAMQEEVIRIWTDQGPDTEKRGALPH